MCEILNMLTDQEERNYLSIDLHLADCKECAEQYHFNDPRVQIRSDKMLNLETKLKELIEKGNSNRSYAEANLIDLIRAALAIVNIIQFFNDKKSKFSKIEDLKSLKDNLISNNNIIQTSIDDLIDILEKQIDLTTLELKTS